MKRILIFVFMLLGLLLFKIFSKSPEIKKCEHCNILLIDIDILRADELPCYGYSRNTAPNICSLAQKSLLFKDNYSTSFWTFPSIHSTISSTFPLFNRVTNAYTDKLNGNVVTMAEKLQSEGYQTVFVGGMNNTATLTKSSDGLRGYDLVTNESIDTVIEKLSKSSKPWFVHYYNGSLHFPYLLFENEKQIENLVVPNNLLIFSNQFDIGFNSYLKKNYKNIFQKTAIDKFNSIIMSPDIKNDISLTNLFYKLNEENVENKYLINSWYPKYKYFLSQIDINKASDLAYIRMLYDTRLQILDTKLGKILNTLNKNPFSANTITTIMSDHGEFLGEYGLFSHDSSYHSMLYKTPLIIHFPNISTKVIDKTTSNIDIFPTILDLVGISIPSGIQGQSLLPFITDKSFNADKFAFGQCAEGILFQNKNWLYFLPYGSLSINQSVLFNKIDDPNEVTNVAKKYPELTRFFYNKSTLMLSYDKLLSNNEKNISSDYIKIDPIKLERLKREGYW